MVGASMLKPLAAEQQAQQLEGPGVQAGTARRRPGAGTHLRTPPPIGTSSRSAPCGLLMVVLR